MIPLKIQCPLPTYRTGAVPAGGSHLGKKKNALLFVCSKATESKTVKLETICTLKLAPFLL